MTRTNQELFDIAYKGLKAQGFYQSLDKNGSCLYRGQEGLKCAIGQIIPDDKYDPIFEGESVLIIRHDSSNAIQLAEAIDVAIDDNEEQLEFLGVLQSAHDNSATPDIMDESLKNVAETFNLTIPQ